VIRFICGNPGAGKGLYGVRLIVDELVNGKRPVFTNLALDLGGINAYIQQTHPEADVDIFTRIRVLNDDEVANFFLHRGAFGTVEYSEEKGRLVFGSDCKGIFYLLDEVQNFFNARCWAKTGTNALFYASQHRKLGDELWLCTQHPANVDKQFRTVAQDYVYLRNLAQESRGIFRLPRQFLWSQYLEPKTAMTKATAFGTFRLDVTGLGSCYNTAAGVGVPGTGEADTKARKKGWAWQWAVLAAVLFIATCVFVLTDGMDWVVRKILPTPPVPAKVTNAPPSGVLPSVLPGILKGAEAPPKLPSAVPVPPPIRKIVGYSKHGAVMAVYYADGAVETVGMSEVFYGETGIIVRGTKHPFQARVESSLQ